MPTESCCQLRGWCFVVQPRGDSRSHCYMKYDCLHCRQATTDLNPSLEIANEGAPGSKLQFIAAIASHTARRLFGQRGNGALYCSLNHKISSLPLHCSSLLLCHSIPGLVLLLVVPKEEITALRLKPSIICSSYLILICGKHHRLPQKATVR